MVKSELMLKKLRFAAARIAISFALVSPAVAKDVVMAVDSTFTTMDPYDANDTLSQAVAKSFYEGLFGFDKDMNVINVLSEGYDVSADGLVYTVKLRMGVKFHDGTDFKADAVKASLDRATNPENKLRRYALFSNIDQTGVVDDYTVRFTLKKPFSAFINVLAHPAAVMISPVAIAKYGKDLRDHPVGTGPFKFIEWRQTDYLKVEKFGGYWKPGYPKVDGIVWKPVVDNNTRTAILQTGEAHFAFRMPPEQIALLKTKPGLEVITGPSLFQRYLSMNVRQKPFDNPKVRAAVNYAINKEALAKVAFAGYAVPSDGVIPAKMEFFQKMGPWPYDVAKAKQLLAEAGYPNGFETELWSAYNHSTAQKAIQFLQQQLNQVGIKVKLTALEAGQRVEKVESAPNPDTAPVRMYYTGWSSSTGEADWAIRPLLAGDSAPPKLFNTAYYRNENVDRAIAGALNTRDPAEKARYYKEVQEQVWKDAPWAFLVTENLLYVRSRKLSGVSVMPDGNFHFEEMELRE